MNLQDSGHNSLSDNLSLPHGQHKLTSSAKKHKCYLPSSGVGKLYSKLEVARFLDKNNTQSKDKEKDLDQPSPENEDKEKEIEQPSPGKFSVEKSEADGLPSGWIKEVKVTKKGCKIRRDAFYIDPVTGYIFRSMKDAIRYIKTGEVGRQAFKPKDRDRVNDDGNVELEDEKACSPAPAKKQKLAANGTTDPVIRGQSSKMIEEEKDERVSSSASKENSIPLLVQGVSKASSKDSELLENSGRKTIGKNDPRKSSVTPVVDVSPLEQPSESGLMNGEIAKTGPCKSKNSAVEQPSKSGAMRVEIAKAGSGKSKDSAIEQSSESGAMMDEVAKPGLGKSKKKNFASVPRRTSRRLAELQTTKQAHGVTAEQSVNVSASTNVSSSHTDHEQEQAFEEPKFTRIVTHLPLNLPTELKTENRARRTRTAVKDSSDMVNIADGSSMHAEQEAKHASFTSKNAKRLSGVPRNLKPDLKTKGRVHHTTDDRVATPDESSPHSVQKLKHASATTKNSKRQGLNKGKQPIEHVPASCKPTLENRNAGKYEHAAVSSSRNLTIREEPEEKIVAVSKSNEEPGVPFDMPLGDLWQDPCIAFAISTLTGISFENSESVQVSSGSNNSEFGGLATSVDNSRKEGLQKGYRGKQAQHPSNMSIPEGHAGDVESSDKERPGSPLNLSFADAWADPCIEFAIKTLTGDIPLECDMFLPDRFQQKASSSQSQASSGLTLQNSGEANQTGYYHQYSMSEQQLYNQKSKNVNLGYSGGTIYGGINEDRSKGMQR